jgi:hypothetical protein
MDLVQLRYLGCDNSIVRMLERSIWILPLTISSISRYLQFDSLKRLQLEDYLMIIVAVDFYLLSSLRFLL